MINKSLMREYPPNQKGVGGDSFRYIAFTGMMGLKKNSYQKF